MPSKCFYPGCSSKYSYDKRIGRRGKCCSLFKAPKDPGLFEKWRRAIPWVGEKFTLNDRICSLHFNKSDLREYYLIKLDDGTTFNEKMSRPKLKDGSIPCIFSVIPTEKQSTSNRKSSEIVLKEDEYCEKEIEAISKEKIHQPTLKEGEFDRRRSKRKSSDVVKERIKKWCNDIISKPIDDQQSTLTESDNDSLPAVSAMHDIKSDKDDGLKKSTGNSIAEVRESLTKEQIIFNFLRENVHSIKKETPWWAINAFENFIVCTRWTSNCEIDRKIFIKSDLTIKIFLENEVFDINAEEKVKSLENISKWISIVEQELKFVVFQKNRAVSCSSENKSGVVTEYQEEEKENDLKTVDEISLKSKKDTNDDSENLVSPVEKSCYSVCREEASSMELNHPSQISVLPPVFKNSSRNKNKRVFLVNNINEISGILNKIQCEKLNSPKELNVDLSQINSRNTTTDPFNAVTGSSSALANNSSAKTEIKNDLPTEVQKTFKSLKENVHGVKKETPWWTVSALEDHIICCQWNSNLEIDRKIIIKSDLTVKVFLENKESRIGVDWKIESVENISKLIFRVEKTLICPKIHVNEGICDGFLQGKCISRKRNLCMSCIARGTKKIIHKKKIKKLKTEVL